MAREFSQTKLTVWQDPGWTSLTLEEQGLYNLLCSQPTTNLAGVLDFLPGRFARLANGLTAKKIRELVESLQQQQMVFLDDDTEELLIRAFIRVTAAWKTPNSAQAIVTNVEQVMSPFLKSVLMYEAQRVVDEIPEGKWAKSKDILNGVIATLEREQINPWAKGYGKGSRNTLPVDVDVDVDVNVDEVDVRTAQNSALIEHQTPDAPNGAQPPKNPYPSEFERFWSEYPLKRDKGKALTAWKRALKRAPNDALIAGAIRYREDPNREGAYTKYAEGWLNGDGWEDEPLPPRNQHINKATLKQQDQLTVLDNLSAYDNNPNRRMLG